MAESFISYRGLCDGNILKVDGNTGECLHTYRGHSKMVMGICISSDYSMIVSASEDSTLIIWNADCTSGGDHFHVLKGHTGEVSCVAMSSDDLSIVSGGEDATIKVWDVSSKNLKMTLKGHKELVNSVAISPSGKKIASGSMDKTVRIWSLVGEGESLFTFSDPFYHKCVMFALMGDNEIVFSGSLSGAITVWTAHSGIQIKTIHVGSGVKGLAINSTGKRLICSSVDDTVRIYNIDDLLLSPLMCQIKLNPYVYSVILTPDEKSVVCTLRHETINWMFDSDKEPTKLNYDGLIGCICACSPVTFFSDNGVELKFSGRIVATNHTNVLYRIGIRTRVEVTNKQVILYDDEIVGATIKASDSAKALEWKHWILAVQKNLNLPRAERSKTATGTMARYKSDWLQTMNILESGRVERLPRHAIHFIIHNIF